MPRLQRSTEPAPYRYCRQAWQSASLRQQVPVLLAMAICKRNRLQRKGYSNCGCSNIDHWREGHATTATGASASCDDEAYVVRFAGFNARTPSSMRCTGQKTSTSCLSKNLPNQVATFVPLPTDDPAESLPTSRYLKTSFLGSSFSFTFN